MTSQHPDWAIGFQDEVWWSRYAQPHLHSWSPDGKPLRLIEQVATDKDDTPKALACYGILLRHCPQQAEEWVEEMWLRFVDGGPISDITTQFLQWCWEKLARRGKRVLILVWDNARWHISLAVQQWIRAHNQTCLKTGQGKRRIVEPDRTLSPDELEDTFVLLWPARMEIISPSPKMSPDYALDLRTINERVQQAAKDSKHGANKNPSNISRRSGSGWGVAHNDEKHDREAQRSCWAIAPRQDGATLCGSVCAWLVTKDR